MKKLITCIFICFSCTCIANETNNICRRAGAVAMVLHKEVNGTVSTNANNHWSVTLPYDIASGGMYDGAGINVQQGIAACSSISVKSTSDGSSYDGGTAVPGDVNTFAKLTPSNNGNKCWCKLDGPITSWWTFVYEYAD